MFRPRSAISIMSTGHVMSTELTTFVTVMDTCRGGARAGSAAHTLSREHGDGGVHSLALLPMLDADGRGGHIGGATGAATCQSGLTNGGDAAADGRGGRGGAMAVVTSHSGLGLTDVVIVCWCWCSVLGDRSDDGNGAMA